jgi:flagellar biosynthesis/type III secretory pathway protein FliH
VTVRILRRATTDEVPSTTTPTHATFVATARRIHASEFEARLEGERIVAAARREAEAIADRARTEGMDAGRMEALSIVAAARADEARAIDRLLGVVVTATRAVAERALGRALSIEDDALVGWAREALAPLRGARKIVVRGHPASIDRLRARMSELGPSGNSVLELVSDPAMAEGTLLARSELGEVKVELRTQVAAFVDVLREALAPAVRGNHG